MFLNPAGKQSRKRIAGANQQIFFNKSGAFAADSTLTYNSVTDTLTVGNSSVNVATNTTSLTIGNTSGLSVTSASIIVGNDSVNTFINSSAVSIAVGQFTGNGAGLTSVNAANLGGVPASSIISRSFDVLPPTAGDTYTLWHTKDAITISEIVVVQTNSTAGWANLGFFSGTTKGTVVQTIFSANTANNTTGNSYTTMTYANVAANSWIWCNVGGVSAVTELHATIRFSV